MKVYGWVWQGAAWLAWPNAGAPVMLATSSALIGALVLVYHQGLDKDHRPPNGPPTRAIAGRCVVVGLVGGTCTVAFLFLAVTAAPLAWPLIALCAATSPWTLRRARRALRDGRRRSHSAALLGQGDTAWWAVLREDTQLLSERQECLAWRASFAALLDAA